MKELLKNRLEVVSQIFIDDVDVSPLYSSCEEDSVHVEDVVQDVFIGVEDTPPSVIFLTLAVIVVAAVKVYFVSVGVEFHFRTKNDACII